ncbi:GAF domain-containing protein [Flavobacterium sp. JP2137]|uniref:GAF domain-containing protein n=1 Tax=Flavobacterium sp. JP2137 TaxID=3414510 RepID=UPI003D2FEBCB
MKSPKFESSPFRILISFHKWVEEMERVVQEGKDPNLVAYYQELLVEVHRHPELISGMQTDKEVFKNEALIAKMLETLFPVALTNNEIKAISLPFQNLTFNYSNRFKKILADAGEDFEIIIRDLGQHEYYIMCCCIILNYYYKADFDLSRPYFSDIPDAKGIMKHYRMFSNADFIEVVPTATAIAITPEDIHLLKENYHDLALWQKKFPPEAWIIKGFGILSLVDVTIENALSSLKGNLLKPELERYSLEEELQRIFSSIFKIRHLQIGFTPFLEAERIIIGTNAIVGFASYSLRPRTNELIISPEVYKVLFEDMAYFSISDMAVFAQKAGNEEMGQYLLSLNIRSCILAPIVVGDKMEGIIEIVSPEVRALHSVNARKLDNVMPIILDTFERVNADIENQVEAIIQKEYTTIHPSVYWKFLQEARKAYFESIGQQNFSYKEITFERVYPLFGQTDIKGSTAIRNEAVLADLKTQVNLLLSLLKSSNTPEKLLLFEQRVFELERFAALLKKKLISGVEQQMEEYIINEIHPLLRRILWTEAQSEAIVAYFKGIDHDSQTYYQKRKLFDATVAEVNKKLSAFLDGNQVQAQQIFPHYYERFRSDGVDHNMYIGASIHPKKSFDLIYLHNLRLWQLQVMSEMVYAHERDKETTHFDIQLTSLVLIYDAAVAIRFRMDEKRFDIDGSYHSRYEVIKKRLDKARVINTQERIVQPNKITIVYMNPSDRLEYLKYINYLQFKNVLLPHIEELTIENLQGIAGLQALRVEISRQQLEGAGGYTYENLMTEFLKNQHP